MNHPTVATSWVALKHGNACIMAVQQFSAVTAGKNGVQENKHTKATTYPTSATFEGSLSRSQLLEDGSYMTGSDNLEQKASIKHRAGQGT